MRIIVYKYQRNNFFYVKLWKEIYMVIELKGPIEHFLWGKFIICGKEHSSDTGVGKDIRVKIPLLI